MIEDCVIHREKVVGTVWDRIIKGRWKLFWESQRPWKGGNNSPPLTGIYFKTISVKARDLTKTTATLELLVLKTGEYEVSQDVFYQFFSKPLKSICRVLFCRVLRTFSLCVRLIVVFRITLPCPHKEVQEECRGRAHRTGLIFSGTMTAMLLAGWKHCPAHKRKPAQQKPVLSNSGNTKHGTFEVFSLSAWKGKLSVCGIRWLNRLIQP